MESLLICVMLLLNASRHSDTPAINTSEFLTLSCCNRQVIAAFNRVRMLTQDWGIIVEALAASPVVEVGAGGTLLRAREGWGRVGPPAGPARQDRARAARSAQPRRLRLPDPPAEPQRPRAVSVRSSAAQDSQNGPLISAPAAAAHPSEPGSDAGQSAGETAPAMQPVEAATAAAAGKRHDGEQPGLQQLHWPVLARPLPTWTPQLHLMTLWQWL